MAEQKQSPLSEFRFRLIGAPLDNAPRRPTLSFKIKRNACVVEARTNVPNDKDYGRISLNFGVQDFFALLQLIQDTIDAEPGAENTMAYQDRPWTANGRASENKLVGKISIGKNKDGIVYAKVASWDSNRPVVSFPFLPSNQYELVKADGNRWDRGELSKLYARSWCKGLTEVMPQAFYGEYVPPPPRNPQGGQGGGYQRGGGNYQRGNNQGGNNYGGGQQSSNQPSGNQGGSDSWGSEDDFPL